MSSQREHRGRMSTRGWCKIDLFDDQLRLMSGRWRMPVRIPPVKAHISTANMNSIPQVNY